MKKTKAVPIRKLIKKLDTAFSIHTRKKYADEHGMVKCFTCPKVMHWKEAQLGHYVSRKHMSLRFDPRNCHVQGAECNIFRHGALDVYALALQEKYGEGILKELNQIKNQTKQWKAGELQELIKKYSV